METAIATPYTVALHDAPSNLPAAAKIAAEARYARELEKAFGGAEQVAAALDAVLTLVGADVASAADKKLAARWQNASSTARDRALAQIGEVEEAYFEVSLA